MSKYIQISPDDLLKHTKNGVCNLWQVLYTIADKEERRRAAWYFGHVPSPTDPGNFDYSYISEPIEIRWGKKSKLAAEVLVFDSPEKTHIRMPNFLLLCAQGWGRGTYGFP